MFASVRFPTFRVDETICDARYLLMYLKTKEGISQLGKISPGSAGRNRVLSLKRLNEIMIPVIPLHLQKSLMDNISYRIDNVFHLQEKTASELDVLVPSIFKKAFCGEL